MDCSLATSFGTHCASSAALASSTLYWNCVRLTRSSALLHRLEIDLDAAVVERGVGAVHADEAGNVLDRGVFQDDLGQRLLALGHAGERNVLRAFGDAEDLPGVLHREEALGNDHVEVDRDRQRGGRDHQGRELVLEDEVEGAAVEADDGLEAAFREMV